MPLGADSCGPKSHALDGDAYLRHLVNTIEPLVRGDGSLYQITLSACRSSPESTNDELCDSVNFLQSFFFISSKTQAGNVGRWCGGVSSSLPTEGIILFFLLLK